MDEIAQAIPVVVTPHPMEMARLVKSSLDEVLKHPDQTASQFSEQHGCITVMKGSETQVWDAKGHAFQNLQASPALSKGGSGDVLAGALAGVYAVLRADRREQLQSTPLHEAERLWHTMGFESAVLAVLLHAEAGRRAACVHGTHGVLARETADALGPVMELYLNS